MIVFQAGVEIVVRLSFGLYSQLCSGGYDCLSRKYIWYILARINTMLKQ